ncbi:LPD1 domain-containing protein, partial [Immundisolibacter sp.]
MEPTQNLSDFFSNNAQGSGGSPGTSLSGFFDSQAKPKTPAAPQGRVSDVSAIIAQEGADHLKPVIEAIYKQESGAGSNARTSIDGAQGGMQVIPATFQRYAKPGERIDNPDDNMRVGVRIIKDLARRFGNDPAKIATGYFSGEGNVNTGQGSAWKNDRADGNGKRVSGYVSDILAKVGGISEAQAAQPTTTAPDLTKAPKWADIAGKPEFTSLPPKKQTEAKAAYFDYYIAPHAGQQAAALRQQFMQSPTGAPDRTWGEAAGDTGVQLAEGVNTILGAIPNLVSPEGDVAGFFNDNAQFWRDKQSKTLQGKIANADKAITKAGEDGVISQIVEASSQYFTDPALAARFITTNLPSMIPGIGAAKLAQAAALAKGASAARAAQIATTAAGATNAALNAGGARGEAFEDIKRTLIQQGMSPEQAEQKALADSRIVAAVGGIAGYVSGKTGLEKSLFGQATTKGAIKSGVAATATELAGEQLEEVAPKITTNIQAGQYNNRSVGQGVGRTIVETAIGSGPGALVAGGVAARNALAEDAPQPTTADLTSDGRIEPNAASATKSAEDAQIDTALAEAKQPPAKPPASPAEPMGEAREIELWAKASDGTITPEEKAELVAIQQGQPAQPPAADAMPQDAMAEQGMPTPEQLPPDMTMPAPLDTRHPTEQAADAVVVALAQEAGIPIETVLPPSTAQQATPLPESGAPQPVDLPPPQPGAEAGALPVDTLAQASEIPSMAPSAVEIPARPRTEKEARALRAQQQEISNAPQAAEAALPAVQEETRQGSPLPEQVAAPKTEREAREQRRKTDILTPDGKKVSAQWDVVEADSIKASLKEGVSQPRDRTRAASNAQVLEIAGNPDFERLSDTSKTMDYGAPTLSADGLIVGGNGRFEGVSRAYDGPTATAYRAAVEQAAPRFGLDADAIRGMKKPVLVRRITDNADTRQLAIQSNQAAGLQMSDMEQAALDSERMKSLEQIEVSDTGDIPLTSRNMQAIQQTLAGYSTNELAGMMTADGGLSQSGMRRLRNAILFSAYGKSDTLARLIESPDADMKNVGTALVRAAGKLAKVRTGIAEGGIPAEFDIAGDLTAAIETLSGLRAEGKRLDEFLAQGDMFGGGLSQSERSIIQFLADNLRSAKAITEGLAGYAERVLSTQNRSGGLFGDAPMPTKTEVLNDATKRFADERAAAQSQQSIFDQPAPELHADTTGGNREVQAGESGNRPDTGRQSGDEAARESEGRAGTDAGSREDAAGQRAGVATAEPIALQSSAFRGATMRERALAAFEFARRKFAQAVVRNTSDGADIIIPASGVKHALSGQVSPLTLAAVKKLDEIVASAEFVAAEPDKKGRNTIKEVRFYERDVLLDGEPKRLRIVVRVAPDGSRYYDHFEAQEKAPAGQSGKPLAEDSTQPFTGAAPSEPSAESSIADDDGESQQAEKVGAGGTAATDAVTQAAAIEPAQPQVELLPVTEAQAAQAKTQESKIGDMGRKVIVRKDTATPTGSRAKAVSTDERPAWMRKYHAMEVTTGQHAGKWELMEEVGSGRMKGAVKRISYDRYATEQEAMAALPLVVVAKRHRAYSYKDGENGKMQYGVFRHITDRKRAMVKGGFASQKEAMEYIATHPVEVIEHKFPFPERPWLDKIERSGKDWRKGKNVTKQMFEDTFAPGAVVYGNWLLNTDGTVNDDGQELSNHIYDSLRDLAEAIKVPPKALFLNGELALGIGADGKGGKNSAAAHYDPNPGKVLINLTKIKGAGSAAHEWWHAVDHYFARNGGYKDSSSVVAGNFPRVSKARPELVEAIKRVVDTMMYSTKSQTTDADVVRDRAQKRVDDAVKNLDYYTRDLRSTLKEGSYNKGKKVATEGQLQQWDAMVERLKAGDMGEKVYIDNASKMRGALGFETGTVLRDMNALYKTVTGRSFLRQDPESTGRRLHWVVQAIKENMERTSVEQDETHTYKGRTDYYLEAKEIDSYRTGDYWSMPEELGARAFESYIFDKLTDTGSRSDYLVYAVENRYYASLGMKPYPEGAERQAINAAFDKLFDTVQTKETDAGVAMFSAKQSRADLPPVAQSIVDELVAGLPGVRQAASDARIITVFAPSELPAAILKEAEEQGIPPNEIHGVLHNGFAYIVRQNLKNRQDVEEVLAHEILGHGGVHALLGDSREVVLLESFNRAGGIGGVRAIASKHGVLKELDQRLPATSKLSDEQKISVVDEMLALAQGKNHKLRQAALEWWNRVRNFIIGKLDKAGLHGMAAKLDKYDAGEAAVMLRQMREAVIDGGDIGGHGVAFMVARKNSNQPPLGLTGGKPANPQPELPGESPFRFVQRRVQDKLNRFTVIKDWLAEQGVKLSELADVYKAEERMHSRFANKAEDFREKRVKPLVEKIQKAGFSMDDVAQFLHAQHAQERNAQVAKVNQDRQDGGSGMTDAEAKAILAKASPELKKLANEFRAIADDTLAILVNSGMVSKEQAAAYRAAYQHYVPLKGGPDDGKPTGTGKGLSARHKIKRALGHEMREGGEWIIENILADHQRAIMLAEKNRVGIHLLNMAVEAGRDDLLTIDKPKKRQVLKENVAYEVLHKGQVIGTFDSQEAARLFKGQAMSLYKSSTPSHFSIRRTSDPAVLLMASPMPADNEVIVYVHGHEIRVQINDEILARAYKNMGTEAMNAVIRVGAGLNAFFSRIYTGYNPEFIVTNIVRDFTTGLANITGEHGIAMAGKATKNYAARFVELFKYAYTGTETQWVKMYREDGGNTGAAYLTDIERLGKEIQTEYAAYRGVTANLKDGDYKNAARAAGRKVFDKSLVWIERLNQAGENAMRLAVYQAMIESGRTRNEAASAAKNATVNFNRKGELGQQANALWLFFNAGVQGTAAIAHAHAKGKHRKQAWAFSSTLMGLGYLVSLAAAGGDEDDYEKVSEYERSRNLLIKTGDGYAKIPLPYGYGFFWNMGRGMADAQRTGELGKMPWQVASSFVEEFTPFGAMVAG